MQNQLGQGNQLGMNQGGEDDGSTEYDGNTGAQNDGGFSRGEQGVADLGGLQDIGMGGQYRSSL